MADTLEQQIEAQRDFGHAVCRCISENIAKLGLPLKSLPTLPQFDNAEFSLVTDPFTQSRDLVGHWYNRGRQRIGQIQFHGDGSCYAEYDVVQPHPNDKRYFIEAINVWGRQGNIKAEAKLLDMP